MDRNNLVISGTLPPPNLALIEIGVIQGSKPPERLQLAGDARPCARQSAGPGQQARLDSDKKLTLFETQCNWV